MDRVAHKVLAIVLLALTFGFSQAAFADEECDVLMIQIEKLVDKLEVMGELHGKMVRLEREKDFLGEMLILERPTYDVPTSSHQYVHWNKKVHSYRDEIKAHKTIFQKNDHEIFETELDISLRLKQLCSCCMGQAGSATRVGKDCEALMDQIKKLVATARTLGYNLGDAKQVLRDVEWDISEVENR